MGAKDRLAELKNLSNGNVYNETVEIIPQGYENGCQDIDGLFKEVDKIRGWINEINDNTRLLKHLFADPTFQTSRMQLTVIRCAESLSVDVEAPCDQTPLQDESPASCRAKLVETERLRAPDYHLQEQLDATVTRTNATGLKVCGALREFEERVRCARGGVRVRITRLQYAATRQLYGDALARHEAFLQSCRDHQHALLQEQIRLTNLTISDEECQNLLESNNISLFVDNLQAETNEARLALQDVEARHQELIKIENSIKEVRDMFVQMSHLVMQQQDLIDTVEYYAVQATDYVELGGKELLQGKVSKRKARKKKIGIIVCLTVGILIVLVILILT